MTLTDSPRHLRLAVFGCFLVAVFVWFWNDLFVAFYGDDGNYILVSIVGQKARLLDYLAMTQDRPFSYGLLWLNSIFAGDWPPAYRAVTLVFHACSAFLLFEILSLLSRRHLDEHNYRVPLALSALYLVHPIHNQVIQIVTQRGVVLAALFSLISIDRFLVYQESRKGFDYVISCAAVLLAVLSKGFAMATPLVLLLYVMVFFKKWLVQAAYELIPFGVALLFPVLIYVVLGYRQQFDSVPWHQYFFTEQRVLWTYFSWFPAPLHLGYLHETARTFDGWTIVAALGHVGMLGLAAAFLRKPRLQLVGFGIIAAYVAFAPESSIFPIRYAIWEYRTYYPFCFLFIALLAPATYFLRACGGRARAAALGGLLLVVFGVAFVLNRSQAAQVMTNEKFVLNTLEHNPHDLHFNIDILSGILRGETGHGGMAAVKLVRGANNDVLEIQLLGDALDYLAGPPGHRDTSKLERIANALHTAGGPNARISDASRSALNTFLVHGTAEHLQGPTLFLKLYDLLIPQLMALNPNAPYFYQLSGLVEESRRVLLALREYYDKLAQTRRLKPAEQASSLWTLAVLEVYFKQQAANLGARYETFMSQHPEGVRTRQMYEWYKKQGTSK